MNHPHPIDPRTALALRRIVIAGAILALVAAVSMVIGAILAFT